MKRSGCLVRRLCIVLFVFAISSSCMIHYPLSATSSDSENNLINLNALKQSTNKSCALSCLYYVSRYWGINKTIKQIEHELGKPPKDGYTLGQLHNWARKNGFMAFVLRGNYSDLLYQTKKKRPVIVCLKRGKQKHSVVVKSIRKNGDIVAIDPKKGRSVAFDKSRFLREWELLDNPMLLIAPATVRLSGRY